MGLSQRLIKCPDDATAIPRAALGELFSIPLASTWETFLLTAHPTPTFPDISLLSPCLARGRGSLWSYGQTSGDRALFVCFSPLSSHKSTYEQL